LSRTIFMIFSDTNGMLWQITTRCN